MVLAYIVLLYTSTGNDVAQQSSINFKRYQIRDQYIPISMHFISRYSKERKTYQRFHTSSAWSYQ